MRYHYDKPTIYLSMYGSLHTCNHPVYDRCTLYLIKNKGLAVIQQRYDIRTKKTWWREIDACLVDDIYLCDGFKDYFDSRADVAENNLYPTVTVRQIMWALKMKPLKRERWETVFDRRNI